MTGCGGSGKTTLGEGLRNKYGFLHWDADQFYNGMDPIKDAAKPVNLESDAYKNRPQELVQAWDKAQKEGYYKLFQKEPTEFSAFQPLYDLMTDRIIKDRASNKNKHIVMSQVVFTREIRDYLRKKLGDDLVFIILNTKKELLVQRLLDRTEEECKEMGVTLIDRIKSWNPDMDVEGLKSHLAASSNGFEFKEDDEPNTYQIDIDETVNVNDVLSKVANFLNL